MATLQDQSVEQGLCVRKASPSRCSTLASKRHRGDAGATTKRSLSEDEQEDMNNLAAPSASALEDLAEMATTAKAVAAARWTCSICCSTFGGKEKTWVLECCRGTHQFCCACLRKCLQIGWECPFHAAPVPQLVVCGVSISSENYVKEVQTQRARKEGLRRCDNESCHGLLKSYRAGVSQCDTCLQLCCSNAACGKPYVPGHACEETFADIARHLDPPVRSCPGCGQASDKVEGCNIVRHAACGTSWCFLCGERLIKWGCTHSTCKERRNCAPGRGGGGCFGSASSSGAARALRAKNVGTAHRGGEGG